MVNPVFISGEQVLRQIFAIIILVNPLMDDWSKNVAEMSPFL